MAADEIPDFQHLVSATRHSAASRLEVVSQFGGFVADEIGDEPQGEELLAEEIANPNGPFCCWKVVMDA